MVLGFDKMTATIQESARGTDSAWLGDSILPAAFFGMWATRRVHERGTKPEHPGRQMHDAFAIEELEYYGSEDPPRLHVRFGSTEPAINENLGTKEYSSPRSYQQVTHLEPGGRAHGRGDRDLIPGLHPSERHRREALLAGWSVPKQGSPGGIPVAIESRRPGSSV
jgi:hypothetical protein